MPGAKFTVVSVQPTEDAGVCGRDNHFPCVGHGTGTRAGTRSTAPLGGSAQRMYHLSKKSSLLPLWRLSQCVGMCVSVCSALVPVEEMLLHVGMRILCKFSIRMRTCYLSFEKHQERKRIQYDKSIFLLLKGWVTESNNVKRDIITGKICKCYFTPIVTKIF